MSSGQVLFNPQGRRIGLVRAVNGQLENFLPSLSVYIYIYIFFLHHTAYFNLFFVLLIQTCVTSIFLYSLITILFLVTRYIMVKRDRVSYSIDIDIDISSSQNLDNN